MNKVAIILIITISVLSCRKDDKPINPNDFVGSWNKTIIAIYDDGVKYDTIRNYIRQTNIYSDGTYHFITPSDTIVCYWYYNDVNDYFITYEIKNLITFSEDKLESISKNKIKFKTINGNFIYLETLDRLE